MSNIASLPKWAQQHIEKLEADVAYWRAAASAGPEDSDTFVRRGVDNDQPLGKRPIIRFRTGRTPSGHDHLDATLQGDGGLVVRTGWNALAVYPSASTAIVVRALS